MINYKKVWKGYTNLETRVDVWRSDHETGKWKWSVQVIGTTLTEFFRTKKAAMARAEEIINTYNEYSKDNPNACEVCPI
tara:strand:+ start:883 stop:1119 length:237 start_codon:yes stop_codon:yes gene_type:complete